MSQDCLFCKISEGRLAADKVYEDENVLVFRDINPQAPVHCLVIPRIHISSLSCPEAENPDMLVSFQRAVASLAAGLPEEQSDYRLVVNCGAGAGQTVFHLHWHFLAGRPFNWPPG